MELLQSRHLVIVRHGESEGDVRRKLGTRALIHPNDEKQTEAGHRQLSTSPNTRHPVRFNLPQVESSSVSYWTHS